MRNKRFLCLLFCLALFIASAFMLSACGGDEEPSDLPTIEGVTFSDATFTYDGTEKTISVQGAPEGATVTYDPSNKFTARGTYTVKATVKLEGYQDLVLTAKLTITKPVEENTVTVTFDSDGGTAIAPVDVEKGTALAAPTPNPYKKGYEFLGWYNGNSKYDFTSKVDAAMTLTAKWKVTNYEITYDVGYGTNNSGNPITYNIESDDIVLLDAVAIAGSEFDYWYILVDGQEQKITSISKGSVGNKKIYAKYRYEDFDITYVLGAGTNDPANPATSNAGTPAITLKDAVLLGYDFIGWYTDQSLEADYKVTEIPANLSGPITLYASYTPTVYNITYSGAEDSELPSELKTTYTILESYTFPTLSNRTDYLFSGWTNGDDEATVGIEAGTTGNITLTAVWTPKTYNIIYNLDNGTNNSGNPDTFTVETPTITLIDPTKDYYEFIGWTNEDGDTVTEIALGTSGDVTLNANWRAIEYVITYVLNDGKNDDENPATYTVEDAFTFAVPTKNGYKFLGWFTEDNTTSTQISEITLNSHGEFTIYAQWQEYSAGISYNAMGGTLPKGNPTGYDPTVGVDSFLPATKAGYTFAGWYTSPNFHEEELVQSIVAGATGNFTFYARFVYGSEGLEFTENGDTYSVTGYTGTDKVVYVPETYNGKAVTVIATTAFQNNTDITSVVIPESVTDIAANAFSGCTALDSIVIPASVTLVGADAFYGCTSLAVINCKATSKPADYADGFNNLDGTDTIEVVWGYMDSEDGTLPSNPF